MILHSSQAFKCFDQSKMFDGILNEPFYFLRASFLFCVYIFSIEIRAAFENAHVRVLISRRAKTGSVVKRGL